jgi:predicted transcriptional regulator
MNTPAHYKSRNELREEDVEREGYDITSPVECSREHEVITRMFLALARGICGKYFPGKPLHHQIDLVCLLLYVIIGHVKRRPVTVSKLSRTFGLSRATTARWLSELVASGFVERVGNVYWLTEKTNSPSVQNVVAKNVDLIIAAAKELARTKVAKMNR